MLLIYINWCILFLQRRTNLHSKLCPSLHWLPLHRRRRRAPPSPRRPNASAETAARQHHSSAVPFAASRCGERRRFAARQRESQPRTTWRRLRCALDRFSVFTSMGMHYIRYAEFEFRSAFSVPDFLVVCSLVSWFRLLCFVSQIPTAAPTPAAERKTSNVSVSLYACGFYTCAQAWTLRRSCLCNITIFSLWIWDINDVRL